MLKSTQINQMKSTLLFALVLTAGLQLMRVFFPSIAWYLKDTVGAGTVTLAMYVVIVMNVGFLASILHKLLGKAFMLSLTACGVALVRLVEQLVVLPAVDLWISLVGCGLFALFMPSFIAYIRTRNDQQAGRIWAYGLTLGLSIDSVIRGITGTLDLSWIRDPVPIVGIVLLTGTALYLIREQKPIDPNALTETGWRENLPFIALGPYLVLQTIVFQNQGWVSEISGLSSQAGLIVLMAGNLLAMLSVFMTHKYPNSFRLVFSIAGALVLSIISFVLTQPGFIFIMAYLIAQWLFGRFWVHLGLFSFKANRRGSGRTATFSTLGLLLFILLAFIYYASLDIPMPFSRHIVLPTTGILYGMIYLGTVWNRPITIRAKDHSNWAIHFSAALLLLAIVTAIASSHPRKMLEPTGKPIHVMTYNIHSAYNIQGRQDPEAIAREIERSEVDILALQEISRGWLVNGSTDLVSWLSRRLAMQVIYRGTTGPMWGNAIFTRYPILSHTYGPLPALDTPLERGYLWARIDIGTEQPLSILATHLHHIESDDFVRLAQSEELIHIWNGTPQTILLGDLNALPNAIELEPIREAGFVDSWQETGRGDGFTYSSGKPFKRIDWIWHTPDLVVRDITVLDTTASDHLPVVITIEPVH